MLASVLFPECIIKGYLVLMGCVCLSCSSFFLRQTASSGADTVDFES